MELSNNELQVMFRALASFRQECEAAPSGYPAAQEALHNIDKLQTRILEEFRKDWQK